MEMTPEQQEEALKVIEAINYNLERIPGKYRVMLDNYVRYQRDLLKSITQTLVDTRSIHLYSGVLYWEVHMDGELAASIPKGSTGLEVAFTILSESEPTIYRVETFFDDNQPAYPASALQKQLKRARGLLTEHGAQPLAHYLQKTIVISNNQNSLTYTPDKSITVTTQSAVLARS